MKTHLKQYTSIFIVDFFYFSTKQRGNESFLLIVMHFLFLNSFSLSTCSNVFNWKALSGFRERKNITFNMQTLMIKIMKAKGLISLFRGNRSLEYNGGSRYVCYLSNCLLCYGHLSKNKEHLNVRVRGEK